MTTTDDVPEWLRPSVPEHYVDGYSFQGNPYTVMLSFTIGVPGSEAEDVVRIRTSPEHAKIMSILLKRSMKGYEEKLGVEIALPPAILDAHDINLAEDW